MACFSPPPGTGCSQQFAGTGFYYHKTKARERTATAEKHLILQPFLRRQEKCCHDECEPLQKNRSMVNTSLAAPPLPVNPYIVAAVKELRSRSDTHLSTGESVRSEVAAKIQKQDEAKQESARAIAAKKAAKKAEALRCPPSSGLWWQRSDTDDCASWDWKYRGVCLEHSQSAPGSSARPFAGPAPRSSLRVFFCHHPTPLFRECAKLWLDCSRGLDVAAWSSRRGRRRSSSPGPDRSRKEASIEIQKSREDTVAPLLDSRNRRKWRGKWLRHFGSGGR